MESYWNAHFKSAAGGGIKVHGTWGKTIVTMNNYHGGREREDTGSGFRTKSSGQIKKQKLSIHEEESKGNCPTQVILEANW